MSAVVSLEFCTCENPERCQMPKPPYVCRRLANASKRPACTACNGEGIVRVCCGHGVQNSYDEPPECCCNPDEIECETCKGSGEAPAVVSGEHKS